MTPRTHGHPAAEGSPGKGGWVPAPRPRALCPRTVLGHWSQPRAPGGSRCDGTGAACLLRGHPGSLGSGRAPSGSALRLCPSGSARRGRPSPSPCEVACRRARLTPMQDPRFSKSFTRSPQQTSFSQTRPHSWVLVGGVRAQVLGDTVQPATPSLPVAALTHPPVPPLRGPGCQLRRG